MFEKFDRLITTIDNFKYHKFSVLFELIRKITIAHINKKDISEIIEDERYSQFKDILIYFQENRQFAQTSERLSDYFVKMNILKYDLVLMSDLPENNHELAELGKIYLSASGAYIVRDKKGNVQQGQLHKKIKLKDFDKKLNDPNFQDVILNAVSKEGYINPNALPFDKYAKDPVFVKNLKDLLNAIYLLERTFEDVEAIDIRVGDSKIWGWHDVREEDNAPQFHGLPFWKRWWYGSKNSVHSTARTIYLGTGHANDARSRLWYKTIPKAYQASHLLTHLDFSILGAFLPEYKSLQSALAQLKVLGEQIQNYTEITSEKVQTWIQPDQLGIKAGEGLYHLQSDGGSVDIGFLTHFSASLPLFFQQLTESLNKLSPDLAKVKSTVSHEQFDQFEELAEKILVETDRLRNRHSFLLPLYVLNYIRLLQDIVVLGKGVVEHFSLANETSQDVVIEKLRKLKHEYIGSLFLFFDKTEAELMLEPGTLSKPWMKIMTEYWQSISRYANNVIDLKEKAPDLLSLNDYGLLCKRQHAMEQRVDTNKAHRAVNSRRLDAFQRFYRLIEKLSECSAVTQEELQELAKHYLLIQGFIIKERPTLHAKLVENFFSEEAIENHSNWTINEYVRYYTPRVVSWTECKNELQEIRAKISDAVQSANDTPFLNEKIGNDIIKYIESSASLPLIPWQEHKLPTIHQVDDEITQVYINLYEAQREQQQIVKALRAFVKLKQKLIDCLVQRQFYINTLSEADRKEIIQLYNLLQPFFHAYSQKQNQVDWAHFDRKMVQALTGDISWRPDDKSFLVIRDVLAKLSFFNFESKLLEQQEHAASWVKLLTSTKKTKILAHKEEIQYVEPKQALKRANHVFKWEFVPKIPKWIQDKRAELHKWLLENYGEAITNELSKQSKTGIPFPEIEAPLTRLSQPHQLVMIKQIINALYYLEESSKKLADLREDSYQSVYVLNLLQAYQGIEQIYELGQALRGDPYLLAFLNKLTMQYQQVKQTMLDNARPYQLESKEINHHYQQPVKWSALWYTVQALRVMPGHLNTHLEGQPLTSMGSFNASYSAKKTCIEIEELMDKSDSYLQIFLALPQISRLSYQLRDESLNLGKQVHDSVVDNFKQILDGPIANILIEADKFEIEVGLKSGTVSEPIRKVLSKFYTELVFQQQLPSKNTFDILYSKEGLTRRKDSIIYNKKEKLKQMDHVDEHIEHIKPSLDWLETFYKAPNKMPFDEKYAFISWFRKNYKTLMAIEKENHLPLQIPRKPETEFEKAIYAIAPHIQEDFPNLEFRLRSLDAKLHGQNASNLFAIEKQENQISFLSDETSFSKLIEEEQKEQMKRFIELQFNKVALPYLGRKIGVHELGEEYTEKLEKYIDQERERIVNEICEQPIEALIKQDLVQLTEEATSASMWKFVQENYDDYVLLCEFLRQLQLCKAYCSELSVNEKYGPKQTKFTNFLILLENGHENRDGLEQTAKDKTLTPAERIAKLKSLTKKESIFHSRLMNIRNDVEPFTWLWFKQCIEDLLAILHLRKPTRLTHYEGIRASLDNPSVPMKQLYKANGFFTLNIPKASEQNAPVLLATTSQREDENIVVSDTRIEVEESQLEPSLGAS